MLTEERLIVRQGARYWWLFLVAGIVWLLIAWIVLRLNQTSIATVGVLIGVVFLVSAVDEVGLAVFAPGGWKVWHYIMAVIFSSARCGGSLGRSTPSSPLPQSLA
jgi:hypothetical protein